MTKITNIFCLFVFFLFCPCYVYGAAIFEDNFDDGSLSKWDLSIGDTSWSIVDGRLKGEITSNKQSYLYSKIVSEESNYTIEFDSENLYGIDQHIIVGANDDKTSYYQIEIRFLDEYWPQDGGSIRVWKFIDGGYHSMGDTPYVPPKNVVNNIKIVLEGNNIEIWVNGSLIKTVTDSERLTGTNFGFHNYAGNYSARPVINFFDNVKYKTALVEEPQAKTLIIPGLGASWNERAMVFNQTVDGAEWRMTPFVNNYEKLIEHYGENGMVWNYDWRKPVDQIVEDLDDYIDSTFDEGETFEIVGHSLGGLVGRIWSQKNQADPRLIKVTTLGSPHKGSIDAFRVWSGGNISEDVDFSSIALNVLLQLQKKNGENKVDTIRRYSPVLKDLSPTFDFVKKNNQIVGIDSMQTKNDYLIAANQVGDTRVNTFSGIGFETEQYVKVGKRNYFESLLGWWPEGKILGYENGDGDRTVLKESSDFGNNNQINFEHGALPDAFVDGLSNNYDLANNWVFYMGSPAKVKIECNAEVVRESNDFIVIPKTEVDGCKILLEGKEDGVVHFVYGVNGEEDSWGYKEFEIVTGEVVPITIDSKNDKLTFENATTKKSILAMLLELKVQYPKHREIDRAIISAKKENWRVCLIEVFALRKKVGDINVTDEIIDELTIAGEKRKVSRSVAFHWWGVENGISKMIETVARPNIKTAKSYAYWVESDKKMKQCWSQKDYACVESRGLTNSFLFTEIIYWR